MPGPGGHHGGPGGHHGGHHGGPGGHHRPPMGGMHHHHGGMWHRPPRRGGCLGCLCPVIGMVAVFAAMLIWLL